MQVLSQFHYWERFAQAVVPASPMTLFNMLIGHLYGFPFEVFAEIFSPLLTGSFLYSQVVTVQFEEVSSNTHVRTLSRILSSLLMF